MTSKLQCQSNFDIWWVCQDERIFVHVNSHLGHNQPKSHWCYDDLHRYEGRLLHGTWIPLVLKTKRFPSIIHTVLVSQNVKSSLQIFEWQHYYYDYALVGTSIPLFLNKWPCIENKRTIYREVGAYWGPSHYPYRESM